MSATDAVTATIATTATTARCFVPYPELAVTALPVGPLSSLAAGGQGYL